MRNKHLFLFLAAALLISCAKEDVKSTSLQSENIKGMVKSITISHYCAEISSGKVLKKEYMYSPVFGMSPGKEYNREPEVYNTIGSIATLYFDKKGYLDSVLIYDKNKKLMSKSEYKEYGKPLKSIRFRGEDIEIETEYKYNGICLSESVYKDKWGTSITKYKTNPNGIIEEAIKYDDEGYIRWKEENTIENGKIVKTIYYPGEFLHPELLEDPEEYDDDEAMPTITEYTYNGEVLASVKRTHGDDITEYFLNEYGYLIKLESNKVSTYQYHYNSNNDLEMSGSGNLYDFDGNRTIFHFTYEYDDHNNWIKRIGYSGKKPIQLDEREIEYY